MKIALKKEIGKKPPKSQVWEGRNTYRDTLKKKF